MKALVYHGNRTLRWEEIPPVHPQEGEALVRVKSVGICGSDIHGYLGLTGRRTPPMVMGHEFSGEIAFVQRESSFKKGDRVVIQPLASCGQCLYCQSGFDNICPDKKFFGVFDCNGGMSEFLCVPERLLFKISDSISDDWGALIEPLSVAYSGVKKLGDLRGKSVIIVGAGSIGLMVLLWCRRRGADKVFISDINTRRLKTAEELQAAGTVNPQEADIFQSVMGLNGQKRLDFSIEAAGLSSTAKQSIELLAPRGRAVWIGNSEKTIALDMQKIVTEQITIQGSYTFTQQDFKEVLALMEEDPLELDPLISKREKMSLGPGVFEEIITKQDELIKVILYNE